MLSYIYFAYFLRFVAHIAAKVGLSYDLVAQKLVKIAQVPDLPIF